MVSKLIPAYISNLSKVKVQSNMMIVNFLSEQNFSPLPVNIICLHNRGVEEAVINYNSFCKKMIALNSTNV